MIDNIKKTPEGWRIAKVKEILSIRNGYAFKSTDYSIGGIPIIRQTDLKLDYINISDAKRVPNKYLSEYKDYIIEEGDILIGMSGSLGKIARYNEKVPALQNQRTGLLKIKPEYSNKFAVIVLKYIEPQIILKGKGVAVQNVSYRDIEECTFPLPPIEKCNEIVSQIEKQFTRLDAGVAALKRLQNNLKRYRASVLKAACEGKLVPTEAELARQEGREYEPASVLLERILKERREKWMEQHPGKKYVEPKGPDTTGLPPLPEGWVWGSADAIFTFITSGSRGWAQYYSDKGALFLRVGNLNHDSIDIDLHDVIYVKPPKGAEGTRTRVLIGDILISITADVGMIALIKSDLGEAYINQHVAISRPVNEIYKPFLAWYLSSQIVQKQLINLQRGATKQGIGLDDIRQLVIAIPPLAEQICIFDEIDSRLSVINGLESAASSNLKRTERLRQAVLQRAFEGEITEI